MKTTKKVLSILLSLMLLLGTVAVGGMSFSAASDVVLTLSPSEAMTDAESTAELSLAVEGLGTDPSSNRISSVVFASSDTSVVSTVTAGNAVPYTPSGESEATGLQYSVSAQTGFTGSATVMATVTDTDGNVFTCTACVIVRGIVAGPKNITLEVGEAAVIFAERFGFTSSQMTVNLAWAKNPASDWISMGQHGSGRQNEAYYVKANAVGTGTVTVSLRNGSTVIYSDTIEVNVVEKKSLIITQYGHEVLSPIDLSLPGSTVNLQAVAPYGEFDFSGITWESSHPDLVEVSQNPDGSATVTRVEDSDTVVAVKAVATDGVVTRTKTVYITGSAPEFNIVGSRIRTVSYGKQISINEGETAILSVQSSSIDPTATIWSVTTDGGRVPVRLNSTVGQNITIFGRLSTESPVIITAENEGYTDTVYVNVRPTEERSVRITSAELGADGVLVLAPGASAQLSVEVSELPEDSSFVWKSSNAANNENTSANAAGTVSVNNLSGSVAVVTAGEATTDFSAVGVSVNVDGIIYSDEIYVKVTGREIIKNARYLTIFKGDSVTLRTDDAGEADWRSNSQKVYFDNPGMPKPTGQNPVSEIHSSAIAKAVSDGNQTHNPVKITVNQNGETDSAYVMVKNGTWQSGTVQVRFDLNGGYGTTPDSAFFSYDDASRSILLEKPDAYYPSDDGEYEFYGWSKYPNAVSNTNMSVDYSVYFPGQRYTVQESVTLYAIWTKKAEDALFCIRTTGDIPPEPSNQDNSLYTRSGIYIENVLDSAAFYYDINGVESRLAEVPSDADIARVLNNESISYDPGSDRIIWYVVKRINDDGAGLPNWHVDGVLVKGGRVSLTYDKNTSVANVERMPNPPRVFYDVDLSGTATAVLTESVPRAYGIDFIGWNTMPDGSGQWFSSTGTLYNGCMPPEGETVQTSIALNEDTTLYAIWQGFEQLKADPLITLSVTPEQPSEGDDITVTAHFPADAKGEVTLAANNTVGTAVISGNGTAEFTIPGFTPGKHLVTVTYSGDDKYRAVTEEMLVCVPKYSVSISFEISPEQPFADDNIIITVGLPDGTVKPATLTVGGKEYTVSITDGKGVCSIGSLRPDTYIVTVSYEGDDNYLDGTMETSFEVSKCPCDIDIEMSPEQPYENDEIITIVSLPDDAEGNITLTVDGIVYDVPIKDGKAVFNIGNLEPGEHIADVSYRGDDKYNPVTASEHFTVNSPVALEITSDKTEVHPGDSVTYTVKAGSVMNLAGAEIQLSIPEGLNFNSYSIPENLKQTLNIIEPGTVSFNEGSKKLIFFGGNYSNDGETVLMTFTCSVDSDTAGEKTVTASKCILVDTSPDPREIPSAVTGSTVTITPVPVTGISLDETSVTLAKGGTKKLTATLTPAGVTGTITWNSDNDCVTVDNGTVTAVDTGMATVTATVQGTDCSATCEVHVVDCLHEHTTQFEEKKATCNESGNFAYIYCNDCGRYFETDGVTETSLSAVTIPASGHSFSDSYQSDETHHWRLCTNGCGAEETGNHTFGSATYTWSADNSTCIAKHTCTVCGREVEETCDATSQDIPATCTDDGKTRYTASFTKSGFATQTKEEPNGQSASHIWEVNVVKEATADSLGIIEDKCTRCSETKDKRCYLSGNNNPSRYEDGTYISDKTVQAKATADSGDSVITVIAQDPLEVLPEYSIEIESISSDLGSDYDGTPLPENAYRANVIIKAGGVQISGQIPDKLRLLLEIPAEWDAGDIEAILVKSGDDVTFAEGIEYQLYDADGSFIKVVSKDYLPADGETVKAFATIWTDHFSPYALVDVYTDKDAFDDYTESAKEAADAIGQEGDSEEIQSLITGAKEQIDSLSYDENRTLDENKAAVDSVIAQLEEGVAEHRREYTATFVDESGRTVAAVTFTIDTESLADKEPSVPSKEGYDGKWEEYKLTPGGITVKPVYTAIPAEETPEEPAAPLTIKGNRRSVLGYKENQTFSADTADLPEGAEVHWFVNGEEAGTGSEYTVVGPKEDYTIQAKVIDKDGNVLSESSEQNIKVKHGFIDKILFFFAYLIKLFMTPFRELEGTL